jgi:hypothetical protein
MGAGYGPLPSTTGEKPMHIEINFREVYGDEKAYPVCETARLFAEMLGTKTLTPNALRYIDRLGYEIRAVGKRGELYGVLRPNMDRAA